MTRAVTLRLDDENYKQLANQAKAERRSLANYIENTLLQSKASREITKQKRLDALRKLSGIWADRTDLPPTDEYVRNLRKGTRLKRLGLR